MSDRVRPHRHPHTLAIALVISLCAAMLVAVPLAAPADAAALAVNITRLYDGTAPFEDWSPGDTTTPTPDGLHQPGDDLDGNNGIVRTLDDVSYRIEYSVNPPLPSGDLVLEVELTNGGWREDWAPGASTCPGGSSFSADRSLWTCDIGVVSSASGTVAIDMPAVPPASAPDGSQLQAQVRITEDADPFTTQTANATVTTVSAAPRFEVTKVRVRDAQAEDNSLGETGLTSRYFVGLHAADPDPRGLSALTEPLTVTDHFGVPGAELACFTSGIYGSMPFHDDDTPTDPDRAVSTTDSTCTQTGDSLDIQWHVNWDRTAPPPTQGAYGSLYSYAHDLIAYDLVTAWLPIATVDAADGTPGDGQGQLYSPNAIETSVGGVAASGSCSGSTWSAGAGTSTFDPLDIAGASNMGPAVEPVADNGACTRFLLDINTTGQKGGPYNGSAVIADQDFAMQQYLYNTASTGPSLPDRTVCDKLDNSRFTLNSAPTFGTASGSRWVPSAYTIEYGIGPWGEAYPAGAKADDANAWYVQATSDCSDATAIDLGGGQRWVDNSGVDWTNSGGATIDADQINMVRITVTEPIPAGRYVQVIHDFHARADLTRGEELRNYSAFIVNAASTWTTSQCTGQNDGAQTCTDDLVPLTSAGTFSRWLQVGDSVARVSKSALGATTLNAGDTNTWRVDARAYPSSTSPPGGWGGWTGSTDIVLDDILPDHFGYVLGTARAFDRFSNPIPIADPLVIPNTPSAGLTTLRWDLGPVPWNQYVRVEFDTKVAVYADSGSYTNYAEVHTANDADFPFPPFPNSDTWRRRTSASVDVVALSSAVISKTSTTPYIVAGEDTIYTLQFGNPGPDDLEWMDAIDILPYDGDTRGSVITADTFTLADVTSTKTDLETWVSDTDPATLSALDTFHDDLLWPADPNVTAPGTAQWPCTFADAQAGAPGCPALADVTALRFIGADPNPSASGPGDSFVAAGEGPFDITLTYNTTIDALVGDTYPNSWMAVFEGLSLPVLSPTDVIPTIPALGIGDLVYIDVDFNGVFNAAYDVPVQGVDIELYEEGDIAGVDTPVGTATTDALGRWFIGGLDNGNYWAYFPSSNTDPGGPLEGRSPALGSVADPNTDGDDGADHNTVNLSGIASGLISLGVSDEPIGDGFVPAGYRDVDVNGTLDFAARGGPSIDVQKTVYTGHTSGADCPGTDSATTATGGDVTWCVTVTNDGDTWLTDVTLDDADLGLTTGDFTLLSGNPALMGRGDTATWYVETTESATLDNDVTATGNPSNPFGNDIPGLADVTDTDNAVINVVDASISVDKTVYTGHDTGASCAGGELITVASGSDVTYCFSVTNTGNTHLADVGIDDTDLGIDQTDMTLLSGDPTLVAPSDTVTWYYDDTATADLTNTATATGNPATPGGADLVGLADVTDTDTAAVDVVAPAISIDKTVYAGHDSGAACAGSDLLNALASADVTYCFEVTNTGDTHLSSIGIDDLDLGIDQTDLTLIAWDSVPLAPGDSGTLYYGTTTTVDLTNTATASANPTTAGAADLAGFADVTDTDTATIEVVAPAVTVDKTVYTGHDSGALCAGLDLAWYTTGDPALTYCFTVTNTGDTHLDVAVDDPDLGIDDSDMTVLSGDPTGLAPGASVSWSFETNGSGDLTNTADVTGNPVTAGGADLGGIADVSDSDTATVDEVAPTIEIAKTVYTGHDSGASCAGAELVTVTSGTAVTYCFTATNTGDTHLADVDLGDKDLGIDETDATLLAGDPTLLAPADTTTWYYESSAISDLTNTAQTSGDPATPGGADMVGLADVTDDDTAQVDVVTPAVTIDKTVYAGHDAGASCTGGELVTTLAGADVTYCFEVTNTGDTYLEVVSILDGDLGIDDTDLTLLSGNPAALAPGATVVGSYETTVAGDLTNTASVTANPLSSGGADLVGIADVTDSDTAAVDEVAPAIDIQKTVYAGHDAGAACAGSNTINSLTGADVTYCFSVTNTGDTHLAGVTVDDTDLGIDQTDMTVLSGDPALLASGSTVTWYYDSTTGADLLNTAATSGNPATSGGVDLADVADVTDSDTAAVNVVAPAISIDKTVYAGHDSGASCAGGELVTETSGADVTYCFAITNTGDTHLDVTLADTDLGIDETDLTILSGTLTGLAPGATVTGYYDTTVTGDLTNTATTTGDPVTAGGADLTDVANVTDTDTAQVDQVAPSIDIQKTVYAGHDSGASCAGGELVTETAGAPVTYCFEVTNTGDTHLGTLALLDADLGIDQTDLTLLSGSLLLLAPGATTVGYYETTVAGDLLNTVAVAGNPVTALGSDLTDVGNVGDTDTARVDQVAPSIDIQKTVYAGHDAGASCAGGELVTETAGADVTYCFEVTNTGDTHLNNVTVDDTDLGIDQTDMTLLSGDPTLVAPGATVTWYYDDTATADLTNTATTTGNPTTPTGTDLTGIADVTDNDTATVDVVAPAITIDKTVYAGHDTGASCAGTDLAWYTTADTDLTYCFTATNTGDTHLTDITLDDPDLGIDETDLTGVSGNPALLAPGASVSGYYQASGSGDLINTATTTGNPADGTGADYPALIDATDTDTARVDEVAPDIEIQTTVYAGHDSGTSCAGVENLTSATGYPVTYCFQVTNTGDTHLAGVTVDDTDLGIDQTDMTLVSGNPFPLAPGATVTWVYETTNSAALTNTATTTGDPAASDGTDMTALSDVTDSDPASTAISAAAVSIVKTVTAGSTCPGIDSLPVAPGTTVTYCFQITNTGLAHLADVAVDDPDLGIDQTDMTIVSGDLTLLAPGDSAVLSYETVTSGDLVNTASATGDPVTAGGTAVPGLSPPVASDDAEVDGLATAITIEKTVYAGHDNGAGCDGDETVSGVENTPISYCFRITNTGAAYLADVTVTDADLGIDQDDMTVVSGDPTHLAPGASVTFVYETTIDGDLLNTATATATPADATGTPVAGLTPPTDDDTAETDQVNPAVEVQKKTITPIVPVTDTAEFDITVTNTGDVPLLDVRLSDEIVPACARTIGTLAVGASVTFRCEGPVGGTPKILTNVARVTADIAEACSADPCVSDEDKAMVEVVESVLVLEKRALQNEVSKGGIATYSFTITNPTRLTIEDVRLIDETFPECSREVGTLGALQTVNYTCDVTTPEAAGELVNKAHVSGRLLTRSYTSYASAAIMIVTTLPGAPLTSVSGGPLAATGADATATGSAAVLLLVLGVLFVATSRRRRDEADQD